MATHLLHDIHGSLTACGLESRLLRTVTRYPSCIPCQNIQRIKDQNPHRVVTGALSKDDEAYNRDH